MCKGVYVCIGLRERLHVRVCVGARACTREAAHVYVCVCGRVWARMRVRALVHAGVRACVYMHA